MKKTYIAVHRIERRVGGKLTVIEPGGTISLTDEERLRIPAGALRSQKVNVEAEPIELPDEPVAEEQTESKPSRGRGGRGRRRQAKPEQVEDSTEDDAAEEGEQAEAEQVETEQVEEAEQVAEDLDGDGEPTVEEAGQGVVGDGSDL